MSENEKKILETFEKVLPDMSELEREKLLSFGEGIAFKTAEQKKGKSEVEKEVDTRANLTPKKIADGYAECDVRLVAGQKK